MCSTVGCKKNKKKKEEKKKGILKSFCHVSFINRDQADAVLQSIKGSGFELQNGKGRKLKFDKPKTKVQNKRWYCLKAAEELLKKDPRTANAQVTVETKMPVRRVLVGKAVAFEQERDDAIGAFMGAYLRRLEHRCFSVGALGPRSRRYGSRSVHGCSDRPFFECCAVPLSTVS